MSCMCGDTACPVCGTWQGTYVQEPQCPYCEDAGNKANARNACDDCDKACSVCGAEDWEQCGCDPELIAHVAETGSRHGFRGGNQQ